MKDRHLLVVIAGHNGAGKTTLYHERLYKTLAPYLTTHINPDELEHEIACDLGEHNLTKSELAELAAVEATRLRKQLLDQGTSFSFETVLSDPNQAKVGFMAEAVKQGYLVIFFAVGLDSIELSKKRVDIRHSKGGHTVPDEKIKGRYQRVLTNFARGAVVASLTIFFDNSEDRSEDGLDTYWDIAFLEDGELITKDQTAPSWWSRVEEVFEQLKTDKI